LRVLHVAAELYPWVKTGGLGDVMGALPPALVAAGADARLCVPGYPAILDAATLTDAVRLQTPFATERIRVGLAQLPGMPPAYVVDHPYFYDRPGNPYSGPGGDWPDNHRRFALLGWVAAALGAGADPKWRPQIVHGHDWHAGLAPAYVRARGHPAASVFTVHNLAYQGFYGGDVFGDLALPADFYSIYGVEYYGGLSFLKAGLYYADRLTTVSPTYAREIQTPQYGMNLDGLLRTRARDLSGILNGVDYRVWTPEGDASLPSPYTLDTVSEGKAAAKAALRQRFGLNEGGGVLIGAVSRLTWQKGLDILLGAVPGLVGSGAQLALLGSGDWGIEQGFAAAAAAHPGRLGVVYGHDEDLAHLIMAGSDIVAVPSRFEPCGLTQMYALRYGALPMVRRTGGLADTVVDAMSDALADGTATGFVFNDENVDALLWAASRASELYADRAAWTRVMHRAMTCDFSWEVSARQYLDLYRALVPVG
jgi:starch synthase